MLKLVKLNKDNYSLLCDMMSEWIQTEEKITPWAIVKTDYTDFNKYINTLELKEKTDGFVPDSTYFGYDETRDIFVGAVNIRHYLSETLLQSGGHIGYGIRPSERRKGYATAMLKLSLEKCVDLKIEKVLVVCYKSNIASAKVILNNGGVLENEILLDTGETDQRYWINL